MDGGEILAKIGHRFRDPDLLQEALTHRSFGTPHNERLEFLGDGALNLVVALRLFERFPELPEGELSRIRAGLVNKRTLYELARDLDLPKLLRLGEGEVKSGGARRPSILADTLEAIFGAVLLDGGYVAVEHAVDTVYGPLLEQLDPQRVGKDPKTRLQEFLQARHIALPRYVVVGTHGRAHEQRFEVECVIESMSVRAVGRGTSRRSAEQEAAENAFAMVTP